MLDDLAGAKISTSPEAAGAAELLLMKSVSVENMDDIVENCKNYLFRT